VSRTRIAGIRSGEKAIPITSDRHGTVTLEVQAASAYDVFLA
jgi:hypothetical protein